MMIKRIIDVARDGVSLVLGTIFVLVAAPIIHLSGMDNVDSCPTKEDIEKSQRFAESLKRDQSERVRK